MTLYYSHSAKPKGNFGDEINAWLWDRLLPGIWEAESDLYFSGIGTILGNQMPQGKRWIVFGSGCGYRPPPPGFGGPDWQVFCVRGPLTAEVLGLPPETVVTDSAILLALLPEYQPLPESEREGICFMPHHGVGDIGNWEAICEMAGIEYLDPREDSRVTLDRIRRAKLILADAMHAAITADTMRVPWIPIVTSPQINTFKWLDWVRSMDVDYHPHTVGPGTLAESVRYIKFSWNYGYRLKDEDFGDPVGACRRQSKRMKNPFHRYVNARLGAIHEDIDKMIHWKIMTPFRFLRDRKLSKRAAKKLLKASQTKPFLSDEATFLQKRYEMGTRLEQLKQQLATD